MKNSEKSMSEKYSVVGHSIKKVDAMEKVMGKAVFVDDICLPGMLCGKILRSKLSHAKILNIDTAKAEKLPGVKVVVSAKNVSNARYGRAIKDKTIFAQNKVRYLGEPIAAVAAVNEEVAKEALKLIKTEYEELDPVFDPIEAMKPSAPLIHEDINDYEKRYEGFICERNVCTHTSLETGDVAKAFENADFVIENTFRSQSVHQGYLEPHGAVASIDNLGKVTVWMNVQLTFRNQEYIAECLNMPMSKVRIIVPHVGGGFGGKMENLVGVYAVLLSQKTNRPVKVVMTREEDFIDGRPRHPSIITLKTGVMKDGTMLGMESRIIYDTGAYADGGPFLTSYGTVLARGAYRIPNVKVEGFCVYTNKVVSGGYRGYGITQVTSAIESQVDIIASKLGIDPLEIRLKNSVEAGDTALTGEIMEGIALKDTIRKTADQIEWGKKPTGHKIGETKRVGRGIACGHMTTGGFASSAIIKLNIDGTATVYIGSPDIGQGSNTVAKQIACEVLGLTPDKIEVIGVDTETSPYDYGPIGDRGTIGIGNAVKMAATNVKAQILRIAEKKLEASIEDSVGNLMMQDNQIFVRGKSPAMGSALKDICDYIHYDMGGPIIGVGSFLPEVKPFGSQVKVKGVIGGSWYPAFTFGTAVAEVEVDIETGRVEILRLVATQDCGQAINPMAIEGQIQGAVAQSIGYALMEEIIFGQGRILNPNLLDYTMPTMLDLPNIEALYVGKGDPIGPFGAKGVGQIGCIIGAPAIVNAIFDAVGVRIKDLPATPQKILREITQKAVLKKRSSIDQ